MAQTPDLDAMSAAIPWQLIVQQTAEAVIFADRDGNIRVWNAGAEALFGFTEDEALGQSLDLIIAERFRAAHWAGYAAAIACAQTRNGARARTARAIHKDGRNLYVELSFSVVVDATGVVHGAVATGRDVTQRHLAERAARARLAAPGNVAARAPGRP